MNSITVYGRLTSDPEIATGNSSMTIARFTVADNTTRKGADGDFITNFFSCSLFGKQADSLMKNARKGARICVTGDLVLRQYNTQIGEKRMAMNLNASSFTMVDYPSQMADGNANAASAGTTRVKEVVSNDFGDGDVPF